MEDVIKQIGINNNGFEIREQQGEWNQDNFIDWYDEESIDIDSYEKT